MSDSQNPNGMPSASLTPPLEEIVHGLQEQVAAIREDNAALSSRFGRERLRWRVQTGIAAVIAAGTLLLSPGARQAIAQGVTLSIPERVAALESAVTQLQTTLSGIRSSPLVLSEDGSTYVLSGHNLQIVSGSGATDGAINGLGNLIVGYNENDEGYTRTGSHNLVVGVGHGYTSYGGFVAGYFNQITGDYSSVSGGGGNTASGVASSVSGGAINTASALFSSVSGGYENTASGITASVNGGGSNTANGFRSSVSGGAGNTAGIIVDGVANGNFSSILGGQNITLITNFGTYPEGP